MDNHPHAQEPKFSIEAGTGHLFRGASCDLTFGFILSAELVQGDLEYLLKVPRRLGSRIAGKQPCYEVVQEILKFNRFQDFRIAEADDFVADRWTNEDSFGSGRLSKVAAHLVRTLVGCYLVDGFPGHEVHPAVVRMCGRESLKGEAESSEVFAEDRK